MGDTYQFVVNVSDFSPEDIIIATSKNQIEVHAEKVSMSSPFPHMLHFWPSVIAPLVFPCVSYPDL